NRSRDAPMGPADRENCSIAGWTGDWWQRVSRRNSAWSPLGCEHRQFRLAHPFVAERQSAAGCRGEQPFVAVRPARPAFGGGGAGRGGGGGEGGGRGPPPTTGGGPRNPPPAITASVSTSTAIATSAAAATIAATTPSSESAAASATAATTTSATAGIQQF